MDTEIHEECGHPWRLHGMSGCHYPTGRYECCACHVSILDRPPVSPGPGQLDIFGGEAA